MDDRRGTVRWNVELPVRYAEPKVYAEGACATHDISTTGARLTVSKKHRPGDLFELMLDLAGSSDHLCIEAEVVWQKRLEEFQEECKYLTGVLFRKIRDCDKKSLFDHVNANFPQEVRRHWWEGCK